MHPDLLTWEEMVVAKLYWFSLPGGCISMQKLGATEGMPPLLPFPPSPLPPSPLPPSPLPPSSSQAIFGQQQFLTHLFTWSFWQVDFWFTFAHEIRHSSVSWDVPYLLCGRAGHASGSGFCELALVLHSDSSLLGKKHMLHLHKIVCYPQDLHECPDRMKWLMLILCQLVWADQRIHMHFKPCLL